MVSQVKSSLSIRVFCIMNIFKRGTGIVAALRDDGPWSLPSAVVWCETKSSHIHDCPKCEALVERHIVRVGR